jgi:lipopolysaccharide transport system ATP-binding protein
MGDIAIRVEGLGKRYRIGAAQEQHDTLRDSLAAAARRAAALPRRLVDRGAADDVQPWTFWALRDVSFTVTQGEVVGIIGANGAGKSTLLKILTRITDPTTGHAEVRGRVGSLLEVGTGFHPELTGRENIFLNGAILGMRRDEIRRKFDEMVEFAEVEKFIDTPVKHYSSGMYLRLAFSVAAHLEPEVLIVDEVLAVGDVDFQKKCLGKMSDVARGGRPVLFVSHNMNAILRLCNRCGLLRGGELVEFGPTADVVRRYLSGDPSGAEPAQWIDTSGLPRRGTEEVRVEAIRYASDDPHIDWQPYPSGPLDILLSLRSDRPRRAQSIAITLYDQNGTKLVNADTLNLGAVVPLQAGINTIRLRMEELHLNPGVYSLGFWVAGAGQTVFDFSESAVRVEVVDVQREGFGKRTSKDGVVPVRFSVTTEIDPSKFAESHPGWRSE